ncbi:hypothetical protein BN1013_01264 [Candidatus Rubidus massiliensis]|nr:hypothetical protein BN1013_01264 [Candidatus Rubidus massiliensis]
MQIVCPSPRWSQNEADYKELIRRIPNKEEIDQQINLIAQKNLLEIQFLINKFNAHNVNNLLFSSSSSSLFAIAAFKSNLIGLSQLATLLMLIAEHHEKKSDSTFSFIPLFIEGKINSLAIDIINVKLGFEFLQMSQTTLNAFLSEAKLLPTTEQGLYIHKSLLFEDGMPQALARNNYLLFSNGIKKDLKVIPPVGLFQTYLNCQFGKDAVHLRPVIALSSFRDLAINQITNTRDLCLELPDYVKIEFADDIICKGADASIHDMYHAAMISSNSLTIRYLNASFIETCNIFKTGLNDDLEYLAFDQITHTLIDFDYSHHKFHLPNEIDCYIRFVLEVIFQKSFVKIEDNYMEHIREVEIILKDKFKTFISSEYVKRYFNIYIDLARLKKIEESAL